MGAKMSEPGLIMSFTPYLRSAMVRFPLIEWLSYSFFREQILKTPLLPNRMTLHLSFWDNVHLPQYVMCHKSCGMCCVSIFFSFFSSSFDKVMKQVGGGCVINGATLSNSSPCKSNIFLIEVNAGLTYVMLLSAPVLRWNLFTLSSKSVILV